MSKSSLFFSFLVILTFASCSKPIADFTYNQPSKEAPAEITFENNSQKAETYEWDFGDENTSKEITPKHKYYQSGEYIVVLKATKGNKTTIKKETITVSAPEKCMVLLETEYGDMMIELYDETPLHRDNFTKLVEEGFYDGLLFHRVINGFMIQGGDPKSKNAPANMQLGSGGPGYTVPAEFRDEHVHVKGALSAARQGDQVNPKKASSGSQFYVVHGDGPMTDEKIDMMERRTGNTYSSEQRADYKSVGGTPFLDRNYTVFGRVVTGLDVIDKIAEVETARGDRPLKDVTMTMKIVK